MKIDKEASRKFGVKVMRTSARKQSAKDEPKKKKAHGDEAASEQSETEKRADFMRDEQ